jgi:hypothetical protein
MDLKLAQYNVHKRKDTMLLLSACAQAADFDIIAIQEPAHNPSMHATYCDSRSAFRPLYPSNQHSRACFLINKRLPLSSWRVEFPGPDIAVLSLTYAGRRITVTNIYNMPAPAATANIGPIYLLPNILSRDGDHLLLGDFNLHHQLWSGTANTRPERMALDLLAFSQQAGLELATPPGLPTWRRSSSSPSCSTIDLAFVSDPLFQHLASCNIDEQLHHGSDYMPIAICFLLPAVSPLADQARLESEMAGPGCYKRRKNWKLMDKDAIAAAAGFSNSPSASPLSTALIRQYLTSRYL